MVQRKYFNQFPKTADSEMLYLDGYVNTNGTNGAVSAYTLPNVTPARTGTGEYTFTLGVAAPLLKSVSIVPVLVTTTDITHSVVQQSSFANVSTFKVQFKTGGSAANLPADSGFFIQIAIKNSGLAKGN